MTSGGALLAFAQQCRCQSIGFVVMMSDVWGHRKLREAPGFVAIVDAAREDGAAVIATLLTHVGWNKPDGTLSIDRRTSHVGREAFAAVGFAEEGPTGASIPEVLTRAAQLSAEQGSVPLSRQIRGFVAGVWPDWLVGPGEGLAQEIDLASYDDIVAESSATDGAEG